MPGLIDSTAYTAAKEKLCAESQRFAELVEAIETELINAKNFSAFPLEKVTTRGPVHSRQLTDPLSGKSVIVVFGFEEIGGETKVLRLDVWAEEDEEADPDDGG